jgi:hypothetical protein
MVRRTLRKQTDLRFRRAAVAQSVNGRSVVSALTYTVTAHGDKWAQRYRTGGSAAMEDRSPRRTTVRDAHRGRWSARLCTCASPDLS